MCGRFTMRVPPNTLSTLFNVSIADNLTPRYNIAPTQPITCVRQQAGTPGRELVLLRWGLVPSWTRPKEVRVGGIINAKAETVATKPAFRESFRQRRCLVPADAFYEWEQGRKKRPWAFQMKDGRPFAFAGLWDRWESAGLQLETVAILTTTTNEVLRPVHDRMPVILPPKDYSAWLDQDLQDTATLQQLLRPYPAAEMQGFPVGSWVNNAQHEGARCLEPATDEQPLLF